MPIGLVDIQKNNNEGFLLWDVIINMIKKIQTPIPNLDYVSGQMNKIIFSF